MNIGIVKRVAAAFLAVLLAVGTAMAALPQKVYAENDEKEKEVVSKIVTLDNGKSYVEVDGKPFMYENVECMGTWLLKGFDAGTIKGYENPLPVSWLENVFEKTAQAGYNTVSIFFCWSDIEPEEEGVYDWSLLDQYIEWADKYDVRLSLTWFGSDAGGGTRLPGYGAGWSCHVPEYLCDQAKYWNRRAVPDNAYSHETRFRCIPGTAEGNYIKECEENALIALTEHLRDTDKTHRMISLMINNESQNIPDSWHTDLAKAVKSVGYDFVIGQHMQKAQYKYREGYDFVGFDDYSTNLSYKLSFLNNSPTALKACLETGGNANNLSSQVLAGITNGGWVQAWQLCDAYSDCNQLGMFETPDAVYPKITNGVSEQAGSEYDTISKPDYLTWEVGTEETLKYGAEKNRRLQLALRKAYWVVAQAAEQEMLSFNLETDEPAANYSASKELNGHTFGFVSDGGDSRGKGSNGMIASKGDEYFCLSDTGTEVTFITDTEPKSATYGHQNGYLTNEEGTGEWVEEGKAKVEELTSDDGTKTWAVTCEPEQVLRLELESNNVDPAFEQDTIEKITIKNVPVTGTVTATDGNYADKVSYSIDEKPDHGTAAVDEESGEWTYTPEAEWCGEEQFTIAATDGNGGKSTAAIKITVREHSSVPVFEQDTVTVEIPKNTVTGGKSEASDEDEGDKHIYTAGTNPSHGTLVIAEDGNWSYTPAKDYAGTDSFAVKVTDSYGDTATQTVNVTVKEEEAGTGANLSLEEGVTIEASSSYPKNLKEYAIDGNDNTLWSPNGSKLPQTLTVDLGGIHELNAVKFHVAATTSFEWRYKIEGSKDSVSWTVLADREAAGAKTAGNTKVAELVEGEYRYVRWTVTGTTSNRDTVSTREFEIWGNKDVISADAHEPSITTQPADGTYTYGETAGALTVAAEVDDGGLISYQWYKNDKESTEGASLITGATDASYTPSTDSVGTMYYYCKVTNRNDNTAGIAEVSTDSDITKIVVNKADGTASVSIADWTYGKDAADPVPVSETNGTDNVTYLYKVKGADDSTYTEEIPTEAGEYTLKAVFAATDCYNEVNAVCDFAIIELPEEKIPERIDVTPDKTEYTAGDELNLSAWKIEIFYTDGTSEVLPLDQVITNVGEIDMSQAGEKTVVLTYAENQDLSDEITITVKEKVTLTGLRLAGPDKKEYLVGEQLDVTGLEVYAVYSDGTEEILGTDEYTLSGFDSSKAGEVIVTIGVGEVQETFTVTVTDKEEPGEEPSEDEGNRPGEEPSEDEGNHTEEEPDAGNKDNSGTQNKNSVHQSEKSDSEVQSVKTGDTAHMETYMALVCVAAMGIVLSIVVKKRKR